MLKRVVVASALLALMIIGVGSAAMAAPPTAVKPKKPPGHAAVVEKPAERWRRVHQSDPAHADALVQFYDDIAQELMRAGKTSAAEAVGADAIEAWRVSGSIKGGRGAILAGAWALALAEKHYAKVLVPYRITEAARTVERTKAIKVALERVALATQDKYLELEQFGVDEYIVAAKVRYGDTLTQFADKMAQAPRPKWLLDLHKRHPDAGSIAAYEDTMAKHLAKYDEQAKVQWIEVLDQAKRSGVSSRWSRLALENLRREFPGQF